MPMGTTTELYLFEKTKLLDRTGLPSEQQLLLVCIVASNDYVKNLSYFGLLRNCDIIRDFDLTNLGPLGGFRDNNHTAEALMRFIQNYLDEVRRRLGKRKKRSTQQTSTRHKQQEIIRTGPEYYRHAVAAFVERMETPLQEPLRPDDESPYSHDIITLILQELYSRKSKQQQSQQISMNDTDTFTQHLPSERVSIDLSSVKDMGMDTDTNIESAPPSTSTQHDSKTISVCTRKRKRLLKHKQKRRDRFKAKKTEAKHKHLQSVTNLTVILIYLLFIIPSTPVKDRHSEEVFFQNRQHSRGPNIDEAELSQMTMPKPRSQKQPTSSINNPVQQK